MTIKVKSFPHLSHFRSEVSGIATVVKQYFKLLPNYGVELVEPDATTYDLVAAHAGWTGPDCDVCHLHGLYWTSDYNAPAWEYEVNSRIVEAVRHAKQVIVPSAWVAEAFQRDMRFTPHIIGHGVNVAEWQHKRQSKGYILGYSKNRSGTDVCDPSFLNHLAPRFPHLQFLTTFAPQHAAINIEAIGTMAQDKFKRVVQQAAVYISSVKETFGCGTLEAMAAGIPVLGVRAGGNLELVEHGHTGYLYEPDNYEDMATGLLYCLRHRKVLGLNGQEVAKAWTWELAAEKIAKVYQLAMVEEPATISVIIPVYNKTPEQVKRAVESIETQTYQGHTSVIIVNDGSTQYDYKDLYPWFAYVGEDGKSANGGGQYVLIDQNNQGVANARNNGASIAHSKYLCFLDSDDMIAPRFLESCIRELEADRSLAVAYSGLWYIRPDGAEGISPWPTVWDYNRQLEGGNQIPTCCVIRREVWERLGGQRQRYAPAGAGEEDGEFWLRLGAYGYKAKLIEPFPQLLEIVGNMQKSLNRPPTEPEVIKQVGADHYQQAKDSMFIYSWLSGQVSGNKEHKITDYRAWHPWTKDGKHPFASYATPKKLSHPVRQYDQPEISVIIPVGPGHEKDVINALDSLEAQTFRGWEAIVVWDSNEDISDSLIKAYPYGKFLDNGSYFNQWTQKEDGSKDKLVTHNRIGGGLLGAGYSRNQGAKIARGNLLLFLDADDTLHPDALEKMLTQWNQTQQCVYTDYVGHAFIDLPLAQKMQQSNRLASFNPKDGEAIIQHKAFAFDCARALRQPEGIDKIYIWNLITTLLPKAWHDEIGGFDESMDTWEDWDYWLRIARKGHCFTHLQEPLVRYRFYTGKRRDLASPDNVEGRQKAQAMLSYMKAKYVKDGEPVACGCKDKGNGNGVATTAVLQQGNSEGMSDSNFVRAQYNGGLGNRHIWGNTHFDYNPGPPARKAPSGGYKMYYGYGQKGLETLVYRQDIEANPGDWQIVPDRIKVEMPMQMLEPPVSIRQQLFGISTDDGTAHLAPGTYREVDAFDLQLLPGVGAAIAQRLRQAGLVSRDTLLEAGLEGLIQIEGITDTRATAILKYLEG